ncbi:mycothione reductase [Euzebya tangerina]|uniref:mycothione reductase n=1 Tax=Euzebya tangerina TaxID=591198 RepID=UPI000E31EB2B|nr:mycothione reductase [Euzebya tangerina]
MTRHFDLAVLGTGSGNSIPTDGMASWSIAIVEPDVFGGTCLNRGCIPSKMFVHAADVARAVKTASTFNIDATFNGSNFPALRDRVFGRIDPIAASGEAYRRGQENVTVFDQPARFVAPSTLQSGEDIFTADRIVLAAGSRPFIPPIDGIEDVAHHTSDTIMRLDDLPPRLVVIGGGAVASEMGHVFDALGSRVTMLLRSDRLLTSEEPEIGRALTESFRARGLDVRSNVTASAARNVDDEVELTLSDGSTIRTDVLLLAAGRTSNGDGMSLDIGGVAVDATNRPIVDEYMRTSAGDVWALGDLESHHQDLKHIANAHAKSISHNLLHPDDLIAPVVPNQPRATFTDPEVASVGLLEAEAREAGHHVVVGRREYGGTAYGWALEDETSFAKVVVDAETRLILGAHIIGPMASILLQPLVQAMTFGQTADQVATEMVWPHPALTEVVENALLEAE